MVKSIVLGGTGFIGSHLVDRLLRVGHQVRVFDRRPEAFRLELEGVDYRYGNFDHGLELKDALQGMDMVFHLVNSTLPRTSNDDPAFDIRSNVLPTIDLLDACVKQGVRKVVFVSSGGTVYGDSAIQPVKEDEATHPLCVYGVNKLAIENYLFYYQHEFGLDYVILRPSNAYGPRQNPFGIQGVISIFLKKVGNGEPVEIWGDGSVVRDYIYVEDLSEGILKAALAQGSSRIFNLGSGQGHSLIAIIAEIEKATGRRAQLKYLSARPFDVKRIQLDIARAARELAWAPSTALASGIAKTWDFVKEVKA